MNVQASHQDNARAFAFKNTNNVNVWQTIQPLAHRMPTTCDKLITGIIREMFHLGYNNKVVEV